MLERILVAVDGSPLSDKAVKVAASIAKPESKVTLVHVVVNPSIPYGGEYLTVERQLRTYGEEVLKKGTELAKSLGLDVATRLEGGDAADEIIRIADAENYDLIVVGSRGLSRVKAFLLGSVSSKIMSHAKKSVLIVR